MKMYCITLNDDHFDKIKKLGYIPVGLGKNIRNKNFKIDKIGSPNILSQLSNSFGIVVIISSLKSSMLLYNLFLFLNIQNFLY